MVKVFCFLILYTSPGFVKIRSTLYCIFAFHSSQDSPAVFRLITCYRPCLSPTFPSRRIPGERLSLLSLTTSPAVTLSGSRLPVHVAVWHRVPASWTSARPRPSVCLLLHGTSGPLTAHPVLDPRPQWRRLLPLPLCRYRCPYTDINPATLTCFPVRRPRFKSWGFPKPCVSVSPAIGLSSTVVFCHSLYLCKGVIIILFNTLPFNFGFTHFSTSSLF